MKKKTLNKKLKLEKQTIANLKNDEIGIIKGGTAVVGVPVPIQVKPVPVIPPTQTACSGCPTQCIICMSGVLTCP